MRGAWGWELSAGLAPVWLSVADKGGHAGGPRRRQPQAGARRHIRHSHGAGMDRKMHLGHLAKAQRRVAQGLVSIKNQRRVIAELTDAGRDTTTAKALLATFLDLQQLHEKHVADIQRALAPPRKKPAAAFEPGWGLAQPILSGPRD